MAENPQPRATISMTMESTIPGPPCRRPPSPIQPEGERGQQGDHDGDHVDARQPAQAVSPPAPPRPATPAGCRSSPPHCRRRGTAREVAKEVQERHRRGTTSTTALIPAQRVPGRFLFGGSGAENFYILLCCWPRWRWRATPEPAGGRQRDRRRDLPAGRARPRADGAGGLLHGGPGIVLSMVMLIVALGLGVFGIGGLFRAHVFEAECRCFSCAGQETRRDLAAGDAAACRPGRGRPARISPRGGRDWFTDLPDAPDNPGESLPLVEVHGSRRARGHAPSGPQPVGPCPRRRVRPAD